MNLEGATNKDYLDLANTLEKEFGRLDGLLHNAATLGALIPYWSLYLKSLGFSAADIGTLMALVMATISKPLILLLDEHIATLDPKTAQTVLQLSDMIVKREKMTTIMITHNMETALHYGNRLIMMHKGRIIVDMHEADKKTLTINDLVTAFERAAGEQFKDDSILLSQR